MDSMFTNLPHFLIGIGLLLLIIEVLMGFTTILLLTLGIAMMLVSGLMYIGILNEELLDAFQKDRAPKEVKSDWIGTQFDLESDVAPGAPGTARFSGVVWTVKSSSAIRKGATAEVVKVEVGVLHVQPV